MAKKFSSLLLEYLRRHFLRQAQLARKITVSREAVHIKTLFAILGRFLTDSRIQRRQSCCFS
ncbi:hypothetical protein PN36_28405 [Candidatus Thiomargarita nelsonii]|uniref:Transposase n=1 Tax=Candidatus Thiomargarita nelsonii TaxID=1003181 RepID=A0A0A6P3A5_9GAMM|nr:hypothetical protein PN36_28405 [Candidatus Thiomargarita nelsonii]